MGEKTAQSLVILSSKNFRKFEARHGYDVVVGSDGGILRESKVLRVDQRRCGWFL
jgi:hypothetical protein